MSLSFGELYSNAEVIFQFYVSIAGEVCPLKTRYLLKPSLFKAINKHVTDSV